MPPLEPDLDVLNAASRPFCAAVRWGRYNCSVSSLYRINISVCRGGNIFFPLRVCITGFAQMPATMLATYTRTQITAPSN